MESQRLGLNSFIAENIKTQTQVGLQRKFGRSQRILKILLRQDIYQRGITAHLPSSLRFTENCKHTSGVCLQLLWQE